MEGGFLEVVSKVGGVRGMINKEALVKFIINLHNQLKNCLSRRIWKNYYSMYILKKEGW